MQLPDYVRQRTFARVLLTFGTTAIVLLLGLLVSLAVQRGHQAELERAHDEQTIAALTQVMWELAWAEANQRGYLLTSQSLYFTEYERAVSTVRRHVAELERLADDPGESAEYRNLSHAVNARLTPLARAIELKRAGRETEAHTIVMSGVGREAMATVQRTADRWLAGERVRAAQRGRAYDRFTQLALWTVVGGTIAAAAVSLLLNLTMARHARTLEQTAKRLAVQEYFLRTIIDTDPNLVFVKDRHGRFTLANRSVAMLYGRMSNELLGKTDFDLGAPPDEASAFHKADLGVIATGTPLLISEEPVTNPATGETRWFQTQKVPLRLDHETQVLGVATDITERKQAQQALLASEDRFRALVEQSLEVITVIDAQGIIIYESPSIEMALGYTADELVGTEVFEYLHPDERPELRSALEALVRFPGEIISREVRFRHKDGRWRTLAVRVRNVLDHPSVAGIIVNSHDVTQTRHVEEQLRQAQKMEAVARLTGGVAHDFNNLLTVIRGYAELVRTELGSEHPLAEDVSEVLNGANRAADLTRQLLAFSRQQVLKPRALQLNTVIADMARMWARILGDDITLDLALAEDLGTVLADLSQIEQVLMNLVVNARDAMPSGGTITIATRNVEVGEEAAFKQYEIKPGSYVIVQVGDTGIGMPREVQERIFEPFFTTKGPGQGTGLGLSTVFGIITQSGGYVSVYSEPGHGTTFRIYLPRVQGHARADAPVEIAAPQLGSGEGILLVEDQEAVRRFTRKVLERNGYRVVEAADADHALAALTHSDSRIHLILTDVIMPGISGTDLANEAAKLRPDVKVVFMSGYTRTEIAVKGLLHEDVQFLEKPFSAHTLLRVVGAALAQR